MNIIERLKALPHDKALHMVAGALIGALVIALGAAALFALGMRKAMPLLPLFAVAVALVAGKLTEMRQEQLNDKREIDGETQPMHEVSVADMQHTVYGAALVAIPALVAILLK